MPRREFQAIHLAVLSANRRSVTRIQTPEIRASGNRLHLAVRPNAESGKLIRSLASEATLQSRSCELRLNFNALSP